MKTWGIICDGMVHPKVLPSTHQFSNYATRLLVDNLLKYRTYHASHAVAPVAYAHYSFISSGLITPRKRAHRIYLCTMTYFERSNMSYQPRPDGLTLRIG
jgi:hypothetical protein